MKIIFYLSLGVVLGIVGKEIFERAYSFIGYKMWEKTHGSDYDNYMREHGESDREILERFHRSQNGEKGEDGNGTDGTNG